MDYIVYRKAGRKPMAVRQGWSWRGFLFPVWTAVGDGNMVAAVRLAAVIGAGAVFGLSFVFRPDGWGFFDMWLSRDWRIGTIHIGITWGIFYVLFGKVFFVLGGLTWGWGFMLALGMGELAAGVVAGILGHTWYDDMLTRRGWEVVGLVDAPNGSAAIRWAVDDEAQDADAGEWSSPPGDSG